MALISGPNCVITGTSNVDPALRITQTGSAFALRIEDSTNPDSTSFIVDNSGGVGIRNDSGGDGMALRVVSTTNITSGSTSAAAGGNNYGTISLVNDGGVEADGELGTALSFSRINSGRRRAMIASFQDGTDADPTGLAFYVRGALTTGDDALVEAFRVRASRRIQAVTGFYVGSPSDDTNEGLIEAYGAGPLVLTRGNTTSASQPLYANFRRERTTGSVISNDDIAELRGMGRSVAGSVSDYLPASSIRFSVDAAPGVDTMPGRIEFHVNVGGTAVTEKARLEREGHFKIGGTSDRSGTQGTHALTLFAGTGVPTGTLTDGASLYTKVGGEMYVLDGSGNETQISPHDPITGEWIYKSTNTETGKTLKIDMERMMKAINDHFGWDFIQEFAS